jgi:purine-binding chemotaxis protein CheW
MPSLTRSKPRRDALDWQAARERLARAIVDTSQLDPTQRQRILTERARALARRPTTLALPNAAGRPAEVEFLHFRLVRERYAIESQFIHQVIKPGELTRVPGAPPHLRGVTNLRGEILPVFDVRDWFDLERSARSDDTRWLVLGMDAPELCLWADAVDELSSFDPRSLHRGERDDRHGYDLVSGVTHDAQTVLDGERLLADSELFVGDAPGARQGVAS